jgi:hypothetical protein
MFCPDEVHQLVTLLGLGYISYPTAATPYSKPTALFTFKQCL